MDPQALAELLQNFLSERRDALVIEDGLTLFDMRTAHYSISTDRGKCILHLWSEERNIVRRLVAAEEKAGELRLAVLRFGQTKPNKLEICSNRDRRPASAKAAARSAYQARLQRIIENNFPERLCGPLTSSMDLKRSSGPAYVRGLMRRGHSGFAVIGVNAQEVQSVIDGSLTAAILGLDFWRQYSAGKYLVEGLRLFVPPGTSAVVRERMANLDCGAAKWELYEFDEREGSLSTIDTVDRGNLATRLVHCPNEQNTLERFADAIATVRAMCSEVEVAVLSTAEVAFRLRGLEFARSRMVLQPGTFHSTSEIVFGVGAAETKLTDENQEHWTRFVQEVARRRLSDGPRDNVVWRLHPERWLESLVVKDVSAVDEHLHRSPVYSQVPAFAASDRAMIDVLATTLEGRLAVIELKAEEDIHLPLQGLDYWARVKWHHERGEFSKFGYFPGRELSPESPLLILVAPALHIHPATDTLLRYLSPQINWTLVALDERWREDLRVVFRKRASCPEPLAATYSMLPAASGS